MPWKYGFKSIKSIVSFEFTEERPVSFWEEIQGAEYGFWANVNPDVPHPRWSQARERMLGSNERRDTLLFNGYAEEVTPPLRRTHRQRGRPPLPLGASGPPRGPQPLGPWPFRGLRPLFRALSPWALGPSVASAPSGALSPALGPSPPPALSPALGLPPPADGRLPARRRSAPHRPRPGAGRGETQARRQATQRPRPRRRSAASRTRR